MLELRSIVISQTSFFPLIFMSIFRNASINIFLQVNCYFSLVMVVDVP